MPETLQRGMPTPAEPMRNVTEPRFQQRPEPAQRSYNREESRPMPEPMRPTFQPPRQEQPQRAAPPPQPQPRAEAPPPQHNESRPAQKRAPREKDDSQQH